MMMMINVGGDEDYDTEPMRGSHYYYHHHHYYYSYHCCYYFSYYFYHPYLREAIPREKCSFF